MQTVPELSARWLVSAVARIYRSGVKADCCLILEGPQGGKKSTALNTLAGPYFADELADLGTKDSVLQTQCVSILELSELDSLSRAEVGRIKAFMSWTTDRFRPPYGKRLIESPRQCVFTGSVNHSSYLRDDSGGRRFWPTACGRIDIDRLVRDRDQLWAEAKARFERGCVWWLETTDLVDIAAVEHDRIIWEYHKGEDPEALRAHYPTLSVEQVNGAIAFYYHHKEAVEQAMEERRLAEEAYTEANPKTPDVKQKFERMRRQTALRRV